MKLKPFFTYFGGKWRAAKHYPLPKYDIIVEPFAGAAGYALNYSDRNIILYEIDPILYGLWEYLLKASSQEILDLSITVSHVDDLQVCQEAKWLIGFWLNKGTSQPCKQPSKWMRDETRPKSFWGKEIRDRIANQVDKIRHWKIYNKCYLEADNIESTWYIDPPYQKMGKYYKYSLIDYNVLGKWCVERNGQIIVCEQDGADWLPFKPFKEIKTTCGKNRTAASKEVIYLK